MTTTTPAPEADAAEVRPRRKDAERNRKRIVAAALELLAERGLALTLNDVAHRAGVGVGTVYRHFPDKADLVDAALADQLEALTVLVADGLAVPDAWEGLVQVLTRGMAAHVANRGLRDVALASEGGAHQVAAVERVVPLVEQLLQRAREQGALRADVTLADITMIQFMVTELADHSSDVRPFAYERYLRLFLEALRARPDNADLGEPLSDADTRAIAAGWIDTHRNGSR